MLTGVSGSGKSSLAFDTVYAEGQRRLLASMSSYAKRFVGQMKKPDVDFVTGMISHHAQALIMSELAPTHGASPAVETLAFSQTGDLLSSGVDGVVRFWDPQAGERTRPPLAAHPAGVTSLTVAETAMATGGRDKTIRELQSALAHARSTYV